LIEGSSPSSRTNKAWRRNGRHLKSVSLGVLHKYNMRRPPDAIETNNRCSYGCGNVAKFINRSYKLMCCKSSNSCPANKLKNSKGLLNCGRDYVQTYKDLPQESKNKMAWAKGLTKETDTRIAKSAINQTGKRRITDQEKLNKIIYREQCQFNLANIIDKIDGFELLKKFGMYNRHNNKEGVVRDHIVSVQYGYKNNIDPKIISHPANCRFIQHIDNAKKTFKCDISVEELLQKMDKWDREGNIGIPC
jgi:hypothetical protein